MTIKLVQDTEKSATTFSFKMTNKFGLSLSYIVIAENLQAALVEVHKDSNLQFVGKSENEWATESGVVTLTLVTNKGNPMRNLSLPEQFREVKRAYVRHGMNKYGNYVVVKYDNDTYRAFRWGNPISPVLDKKGLKRLGTVCNWRTALFSYSSDNLVIY